jgi:hypothetical protein
MKWIALRLALAVIALLTCGCAVFGLNDETLEDDDFNDPGWYHNQGIGGGDLH